MLSQGLLVTLFLKVLCGVEEYVKSGRDQMMIDRDRTKFIARGGGGGTPIWNRRGCSSEILNLTPKGDHLGVAQAFCDL